MPTYGNRGAAALADSIVEVEAYINGACTETNSDMVDIVVHFQGGLLALLLFTRLTGHDGECASFQHVISVPGFIGGVNLTGISYILGWWSGTSACWLMGQALVDQIAVVTGRYRPPATNTTPHLREHEVPAPDWTDVISHHDSPIIP